MNSKMLLQSGMWKVIECRRNGGRGPNGSVWRGAAMVAGSQVERVRSRMSKSWLKEEERRRGGS